MAYDAQVDTLGTGSGEMVKSAYEAALEKLEQQGISRPDSASVPEEARQAMEQARAKAKARLAELEILHSKALTGLTDPEKIREQEDGYLRQRRRVEDQLDKELDTLRRGST